MPTPAAASCTTNWPGFPYSHPRRPADHGVREEAGKQDSDGTTDAVNAEGVQRIVVAQSLFHVCNRVISREPGEDADDDGGADIDETRPGRDRGEPGYETARAADDARLLDSDPFDGHPGEGAENPGGIRDQEGAARESVGGDRAAGIEAEPAEPKETGSDEGQGRYCSAGPGPSGSPLRSPIYKTATRAEMPEDICTTRPPAKSSVPTPG